MTSHRLRGWIADVVVGGLLGLLASLVMVANINIAFGIDRGYEATIGEVLQENVAVGVLDIAVMVGAPVTGVVMGRLRRRERRRHQ